MNMNILSSSNYKEMITEYIKDFKLENIKTREFLEQCEAGMIDSATTLQVVTYLSETAASMNTNHPDYSSLAKIILIKYIHSVTSDSFQNKIEKVQRSRGIFNQEIVEIIEKNREEIDRMIDYTRDFNINYFGLIIFLRNFCIKIHDRWVERPQDVYMRIAIQLHRNDMKGVKRTYDFLSQQFYSHATPTMFYSCYQRSQLASCYLMETKEDSVEGIFRTLGHVAQNLSQSGGTGLHISNIRAEGSPLLTTGGTSKGISSFMKMLSETCKYVDLGGSRRVSSVAVYLEPWHKDILDFLSFRKNFGDESKRGQNIFTALWIPDLFMKRVENDGDWSLFDPNTAKGLQNVYGDEFETLYMHYEKTKSRKIVRAQKIWEAIVISEIETGTPYIVYKDAANRLSNQKNLGTIKSSNLCSEIIQYSSPEETATCVLASVCLPKCMKQNSDGGYFFDLNLLRDVVFQIVENLNRIIDTNAYPEQTSCTYSMRHRSIGIGIQGLADLFMMLKYPFDSVKAKSLNALVAEAIYYFSLRKSCDLAIAEGPYSTFAGSDLSHGIFQFDKMKTPAVFSGHFDWKALKQDVMKHGVRNSLLVAYMPTSTSAQICGNYECFEPINSNIFARQTFAGEFQCINNYLVKDLMSIGMWNDEMRQLIISKRGSIREIPGIPDTLKSLYKTVWEISMKVIIDMSYDRQCFTDQSQSLNLHIKNPTYSQVTSMHFYGWKKGLVTGIYYLHTQPPIAPIQFTIDSELVDKTIDSLSSAKENVESQDMEFSLPTCDSCGA